MKPATKLFLTDHNRRVFGEGPCRLMHGIEQHGSLRAAAAEMNLSYNKAFKLMKIAEEALGFPLTEKTIGGKGGGGSRLTPEAKRFLEKYERYRDACYEANDKLYEEFFSEYQ